MNGGEGLKLKALNEISSKEITHDYEIVLEDILKITCETINARSGAFIFIDDALNELTIVASFGLPDDKLKKAYKDAANADLCLDFNASGSAASIYTHYFISDILENSEDNPWHCLSIELGFSAQIFLTLKIESKIIGLLNVNMLDPHNFTKDEIDFLSIISSYITMAVQNIFFKNKNPGQKIESHNRQNKELNESETIKKEFISNITHELLTPLTSIRGYAELINDEKIGPINKLQKKSVSTIIRNAERLTRLVNDLLVISHLEKDRLYLKFERISITSILARSIIDLHPQAEQKRIRIIQKFQELPDILGDEDKLMQVIKNLLMNSIKFTPTEGEITVAAVEEADHIKISIIDNGIGIPLEKLSAIFDRFYQVDGSVNRKYGGMGLGLSICREIIKRHKGDIWAKSDGIGSTFNITLPKFQ